MTDFKTSDGREVFVQDSGLRARPGMGVILSGEGLPSVFMVAARDMEPSSLLEIQNRDGTAYDTVTRVNLGLVELEPARSRGDRLNIFGGGFPGTGTGPLPTPGSISHDVPPDCEETAVWLLSTGTARYVAVLPRGIEPEDAAGAVAEAIEGPFVMESLYGSSVRVADTPPVPGWTRFVETLVEPAPAPGMR